MKKFKSIVPYVNKRDYLNNGFRTKENKMSFHRPFRLDFSDKRFYHDEGSPYVTCVLHCFVYWENIPSYWRNQLTDTKEFDVSAIAKCSETDVFDLEKGKLIASSYAENNAYYVALDLLSNMSYELEKFNNVIDREAERLIKYVKHNVSFAENVIDGKFVPKKKSK